MAVLHQGGMAVMAVVGQGGWRWVKVGEKRWDYLPFLTQTVTENGGCDMGVSENGDNPKLQCNMEHDSLAPARGNFRWTIRFMTLGEQIG